MVFLNLSTWIYEPFGPAQGMRLAQQSGFEHVEISGANWVNHANWDEVYRCAKKTGVKITSVHCAHHAPDEERIEKEMGYQEYHRRLYEQYARTIGEGTGTILVEHVPHGQYEKTREKAIEKFGFLVELGAKYGYRVATENMPGHFCTADEMGDLLTNVPGLLWTFDPAHAAYSKVDPLSYAAILDSRMVNLHIYDVHTRIRLADWLPQGMGIMDWPAIVKMVHEAGFDGPLTIELTGEMLRDVLNVCDTIAKEVTGSSPIAGVIWEQLFVEFAKRGLLAICSNQGLKVA